ncbi:excinuclease ABC subunit C [Alloacidobacterium dinghuense]|uniref:Excinuclease ABC subunit C n=1 Tax=Alloacidobacterium dinghuense TaxID=2763107 RepID=A0A7G8BJT3_9BACT|nr:excinuclease ABC subunit C [Alloacidobacterium dinghuense]QNI32803.1 excinuclease ABC subunit C [Alloacidobacterium dinghuense]
MLVHSIAFDPTNPASALAQIPAQPGVFALFAADERAEPYLSRTPNLKRRLTRFLDARPSQSKRLRLTEKIARIEYTLTGSDFESALCLYAASMQAFGEATRKRMHLRSPYFLRMTSENAYPRVYVTNKITKSAFDDLFGPFPSRASAEKFCDEMLNLFELRRCHEDLNPDPAFPGCIYSEMKMCLAPCFKGCSDARYAEEAASVHAFLETRGASLIEKIGAERDAASANLEFEQAAQAHAKLQKVQAVISLMPAAVHPLSKLVALVVQPCAEPESVACFLLTRGVILGPISYSVQGMRLHNEQSGSTSLYLHPTTVEALPLEAESARSIVQTVSRNVLEERLQQTLADLKSPPAKSKLSTQTISDHLCLFSRWFYRNQTQRVGEAFLAKDADSLPQRQILRVISRVYSSNLS